MWVLAPWALAVGFAAIARLLDLDQEEKSPRKSIELCVGSCSAMWLSQDGVLRVYAEEISVSCYRMVVDVSDSHSASIPGEVDGYPVRIRVSPDDFADLRAARAFATRASSMGYLLRPVTTENGKISVLSRGEEGTTVWVEGSSISPDLSKYAEEVAKENGVSVERDAAHGMRPFGEYPSVVIRFKAAKQD